MVKYQYTPVSRPFLCARNLVSRRCIAHWPHRPQHTGVAFPQSLNLWKIAVVSSFAFLNSILGPARRFYSYFTHHSLRSQPHVKYSLPKPCTARSLTHHQVAQMRIRLYITNMSVVIGSSLGKQCQLGGLLRHESRDAVNVVPLYSHRKQRAADAVGRPQEPDAYRTMGFPRLWSCVDRGTASRPHGPH